METKPSQEAIEAALDQWSDTWRTTGILQRMADVCRADMYVTLKAAYAIDAQPAWQPIETAPDLLEALQAIADFKPERNDVDPYQQIAVFAKTHARAAIARATGAVEGG